MAADEPHQSDTSIRPQDYTRPEDELAKGEPTTIPHVPPTPRNPAESEKSKYDPTPAWKKRIEIAGFCVLIIYAIATIAIWCANKKAADAAYNAAVTASRQLEMADRPWLKDEVKSVSEFNFQNGIVSWAVSINAQNVGHSVATETFPDATIIAIQGADMIDAPRKKVTELCENMPKRFQYVKAVPGLWNNSIFPNDSYVFRGVNVILSPKDMGEMFDGGTGLGKSIVPVLVGCIEYRYPTSDRPHHTGFIYILSHNEDPRVPESATVFFPVGKNIPKDKIVLRKFGQMAD